MYAPLHFAMHSDWFWEERMANWKITIVMILSAQALKQYGYGAGNPQQGDGQSRSPRLQEAKLQLPGCNTPDSQNEKRTSSGEADATQLGMHMAAGQTSEQRQAERQTAGASLDQCKHHSSPLSPRSPIGVHGGVESNLTAPNAQQTSVVEVPSSIASSDMHDMEDLISRPKVRDKILSS